MVLVGCGDNLAEVCPEPTLFTDGPYSDPYQLELDGCVEGGLVDVAGRWFVRDAALNFNYSYPRYETTCGMARDAGREDQIVTDEAGELVSSDQQFSDGTRMVSRFHTRYGDFQYVQVQSICVQHDGTLAGRWADYTNDHESTGPLIGTRFDRKDELASGLELVGELRTSSVGGEVVAYNLVVDEGIAYVAGPNGLDLVDVSDPAAPRAINHLDDSWNDVRVVRSATRVVAFGAAGSETPYVDVTDPDALSVVGNLRIGESFATSHSLQVQADRLYIANTNAVPVFDIHDPLVPVFVGAVQVPEPYDTHDLTVDGDRLFVNQTTAGFVALDVTAGLDQPVELGRVASAYSHASAIGTIGDQQIALHGDEGMTEDGAAFLRVLDATPGSASFMTELGRYQSRPEVGIHNMELVGDRAYIAYYQDGVRVVDLSEPTRPREVAHYNTWDVETASSYAFTGAFGIRVVNGLIYVADSERGLMIFRER